MSNFIFACFILIPILLSSGVAWLYHAGFVVNEVDAQFATDTLRDLLLESGESTVHVGGVSRNVSFSNRNNKPNNVFVLFDLG